MISPAQRLSYLKQFDLRGFFLLPEPQLAEQEALYSFINEKWRRLILESHPQLEDELSRHDVSKYHNFSDHLDHASFWTKSRRLFSQKEVAYLVESQSVFSHLKYVFGRYTIEDIEGIGYPEIYWRLVRPNMLGDVSPPHKDTWFWSLTNNMTTARQEGLVKIWLPIVSCTQGCGLAVAPSSHLVEIPFSGEYRHGRVKPAVNSKDLDKLTLEHVPLQVGQAIVFDKELLHQGVSHHEDITRVSLEFSIRTYT